MYQKCRGSIRCIDIRGIDGSNLLTGRGLDPLVVDEQTSRLSPSVTIRRCELNRYIGHAVMVLRIGIVEEEKVVKLEMHHIVLKT